MNIQGANNDSNIAISKSSALINFCAAASVIYAGVDMTCNLAEMHINRDSITRVMAEEHGETMMSDSLLGILGLSRFLYLAGKCDENYLEDDE